jgi:prolyl oligopeptidase
MKTLNNKAFGPLASLGLSGVICMAAVSGCDGVEVQNISSPDPQGGAQPEAKIVSVSDTHWGVEVPDPYRYMENLEDPEVEKWFRAQANYTESYLNGLESGAGLFDRLEELDQGAPFTTGSVQRLSNGMQFYLRRDRGENLYKLYLRASKDSQERLLVDPESMSSGLAQHYSLEGYVPSPTGDFVVYGLAQGGSEQTTYYVLDVASGDVTGSPIDNIETAYNWPQWSEDESGFFYSRRRALPDDAPSTEEYKQTRVMFHQLDTAPENDRLIAAYGHSASLPILETDFPSIWLSPRSSHAVLKVKHGDNNEISLFTAPRAELLSGDISWSQLCAESDEVTDFAVIGDTIYLVTGKQAPRFKLVEMSLNDPDMASSRDVVPAGELVIEGVSVAADALYISAKRDGIGMVMRWAPDVGLEELFPPRGGAAYLSSITPDVPGALIYEATWTQGGVRYAYDPDTATFADTGMIPVGEFDNLEGYVAKELVIPSHDGVMIPLTILHKEGLTLDGKNPTVVYGYGSYGSSMNVGFSATRLAWLERGGIWAIAHVRGGGEYGQEWHYAGRMETKPNTWRDLIASAEYLVRESYTSPAHMAPWGGSAGGILAGRAITERPDLFGAAIIDVGSLDTIRAETTTNGVPNIKEFGTVKDRAGFHALLAMSPYHNVRDGVEYPAVMLSHGFNDPRVEPWQSGKMAARLQAATGSDNPVLLRVDFQAGHGIGSTRDQYLQERADQFAFLFSRLSRK